MINLHKDVKEKCGIEALQQLGLWEKGVVKESNYKNHRIFTLKCISNNLILASVKLKSSYSNLSQGTRKIIQRAEKQLLQDRVRCINRTIEESGNTINNSRSRLASIVTNATDLDRCSEFINKVREDRYGKVKERQVRKFNILTSKGNNKNNKTSNNNNRLGQGNNATSSG